MANSRGATLKALVVGMATMALVIVMTACGSKEAPSAIDHDFGRPIPEVDASVQGLAWQGLFRAVAIRVAMDGRVFVADNDDRKVRLFDSTGASLGEIDVSAETPYISDFLVLDSTIVVLDSMRTIHRIDFSGQRRAFNLMDGYEQRISALGQTQIVMASSAQWTAPLRDGRSSWPLARVVTGVGDSLYEIGKQMPEANRYVSHIRHFVAPSGSPDGRFVWLAFLNDPNVLVYSVQRRTLLTIKRTLPFKWRVIPPSFVPQGGTPSILFDATSFDVASDTLGHAYVLTPTSGHGGAREAKSMAVDRLSAVPGATAERFGIASFGTRIAVSPSGTRLYVLNTRTNAVHVFRVPQ